MLFLFVLQFRDKSNSNFHINHKNLSGFPLVIWESVKEALCFEGREEESVLQYISYAQIE